MRAKRNLATEKLIAGGCVVVCVAVTFFLELRSPKPILLESSPVFPPWVPWAAWVFGNLAALIYLWVDYQESKARR